MQNKMMIFCTVAMFLSGFELQAQNLDLEPSNRRCFVGSTFFLLGNFASKNKPDFVQLNIGYRLTGSDVVSLELKTWKYGWSLGIPYGKSYEAPEEAFPGFIREYGFALVYQRFFWRQWFAGVHVMSAWQSFIDESGQKIDRGFQIFNTYRLGYHYKLFGDNFFIQPSFAITHRFYHTKMPQAFKVKDDKWSKFFFGEPGFHFGYNF